MTPLQSLGASLAQLSASSPWAALLLKATLLLAIAWPVHFALARANPRWRALLWRGVAVGLTLILLWTVGLPYLEIPVRLPEPVATLSPPLPDSLAQPLPARSQTGPSARATEEPLTHQPLTESPSVTNPSIKDLSRPIPWRPVLFGVWSLAALLLVLRLVIAHLRFARLARGAKSVPESVVAEAQRIAVALGCRRPTAIRTSPASTVPFLYGLVHPTIILPEPMCEPAQRSQLPGVLAHELAHVRSSDLLWNTFLQLLSILLWFHPLAWRINSAHRSACDAVCDAVSAAYLGNVQAYCRTLAQVALATAASSSTAALAMARPCDVLRRVAALERRVFSSPLRRRTLAGSVLASLIVFVLLAGVQLTPAQSPLLSAAALDKAEPRPAQKATKPVEDTIIATKTAPGPSRATRLTDAETTKRLPWIVSGRVTDDHGQPVEGATLRAHGGMGTLLQTGITQTNKDGRYILRCGPGAFLSGKQKDGTRTVSYGTTVVFASKPGFAEKSRNQSGQFYDAAPVESLDFVLVPAPTVDIDLLDATGKPIAEKKVCLSGEHLPPACNVLMDGVTDSHGKVQFADVPPTFACWFIVSVEPRREVRTASMRFSQPDKYHVRACLRRDAQTGLDLFEVLGVRNAQGKEVREQVVANEPLAHAPLPPELQAKGREILAKMAEANRYWLDWPPPEVHSYRYDLTFKSRESMPFKTYEVLKNRSVSGVARPGLSAASVLGDLTAHPGNTVFRQIAMKPDEAILIFTFTKVVAGNPGSGVFTTGDGCANSGVWEGTMIVDLKTFTPRKCQSRNYSEAFFDYVELRPSHFVPLRVRMVHNGSTQDLRFRVYAPGLWLFASSQLEGSTPIAQVDNVIVNGESGKIVHPPANLLSRAARTNTDAAPKTTMLQVRVVDEAGQPLAGTKLAAKFLGHESTYTADAQGKAAVVAPGPNRLFLSLIAYPEGYPPVRKWWRNESDNELIPAKFTFTFERGRTIGGVVHDEEGKPIQGVKVYLSVSSEQYEQFHMCLALWDSPCVTDSEGRWHLDHVPQQIQDIGIRLEHPDYVGACYGTNSSRTMQQQIEDRTAVVVMKKGIPLTGTVTSPDGKPVADALVAVGDDRFGSDWPTTRTDQEGRYRLAHLSPGGTVLTVVSRGLAPALRYVNVQSGIGPVDFRLEKGNTVRVRIVDKDDKPVQGAHIAPDTWRTYRTLCDTGIAGTTDSQGRWTWTWAPDDAVEMSISKRDYMEVDNLPLAPQAGEQTVILYPPLRISGGVVDAQTKRPIPRFRVIQGAITDGPVGRVSWNPLPDRVLEGKNGQYKLVISDSFCRPDPKGYLVRIEADGYEPGISREFKVVEGSVTYDFSLTKGKSLDVLVRLPDGRPAAGAEVCLCPEEPGKFINMAMFVKNGGFPYRDMSRPNLKVGPDGRLPIQPQDNKFLLIVVHDQGFAQTTSDELAAKPEITLQAWARLEGVVRHGTKPVPGAKLDVYPTGSNGGMRWAFLNFQEQTEADAEGKFVFPKLKPGKWQIRLLPVDKSGRSPNEKPVELGPGQTVRVVLGGEGRPVVGRIRWPNGKLPDGDLSHMIVVIAIKTPEPPTPPKEVRDQGPDAVRAWMKQWQESDAGKTWQSQVQQRQQSQRIGAADRDGSFRIENALPGQYELSVVLKANEDSLPWDRPEPLRYSSEISIPDIPGGVSDEPLDLGDVPLVDKTPKKPSLGSANPPAPQAAGERSIGALRDNLDLLRYVIATNRQNKAKIETWQGKAAVERRSVYGKEVVGQDYSATVRFVFDRARKSIRWNTTLEKWAKIVQGQDDPQPVPQIINGMMTPEGLYRFGSYESPGNPKNRPLVLTITSASLGDPREGQLQPQRYDFNPLYYYDLNQPWGDLIEGLARYIGMADDPRIGGVKIIREGDQVSIDAGMGNTSNRYTLSLNQGCNLIEYKSAWPESAAEYRWTYELRNGIWLPKTWIQAIHQKDGRDEQCKVTFVENIVNQPVEPAAFSLPRLGLQRGDKVNDRRTNQRYPYEGE